ncbi:carbonic anhydrase [Larkinella soli]|uniref:carbonic anhydrase n=1 Tax=Larkinella soli TaxID=1770527 RepID=UPI000FFB59C6|nr:carbonic anhydrase [Larkinella soli]
MHAYDKFLLRNKAWVEEKLEENKGYFAALSKGQRPTTLWIGCSDSRVDSNELLGTLPGELFVHRNIANLVVVSDLNVLSVLQYAVDILKVQDIIVCGHYECGGIAAAMDGQPLGLIDHWLRNIRNIREKYALELDQLSDPPKRLDRLVELNVQEQVYNLIRTTIIREAWQRGQIINLHGWVFNIRTGFIKPMVELEIGNETFAQLYHQLQSEELLSSAPSKDIRTLKGYDATR